MKKWFLPITAATLCLTIGFTSCQKDDNNSDTPKDTATEVSASTDDASRFSNEMDAASNDINTALEANVGFAGRPSGIQGIICDATITVDTTSNPRTITLTFNGTPCLPGRTRTGVIVISMNQGVRWKNAGAQINVAFQNFKITRTLDNKSLTLNGTQTNTNVTGGLLINLASLGTITHTITSSNMSLLFDNGQTRNWQIARQRTFTYNNGIVVSVTGTHTEGSLSGIAEWGTNRFGNSFTTAITNPLVFRQDCDFKLTAGSVQHSTANFNALLTFGLNASGNPTTCPSVGSTYFYKLVWTGPGGISHTVILPY